jgi:hypothetical protein
VVAVVEACSAAGQSVPHHICGPLMEPTRRKATVTMRLSTRTCHQPLGPSPPGHGAVPCGGGYAGHAAPGRFKTLRPRTR